MKAKFLNLMAIALTASAITSCGGASSFGKLAMDSPEAVEKVKEITTKNVDPKEWKLIQVEWSEGTSDSEKLENNLNLGSIFVKLVKPNGQVFSQGFLGQLGWKPADISPDHWYSQGLDYEKITPIDASKLDPATITKQLEEAKAMIPAEYEFKSLAEYRIKAGVPESSSGKGEYVSDYRTEFTFNVIEKGNETVSNAGTTSIVYYEIDFEVASDGTLTMIPQ